MSHFASSLGLGWGGRPRGFDHEFESHQKFHDSTSTAFNRAMIFCPNSAVGRPSCHPGGLCCGWDS